jgi:cytochrome P450
LSDFVYDPLSSDLPGRLYDVYRELRDRHPVHHNPQRGFYSLVRHEDVWDSLVDTESYSSFGVPPSEGLIPFMIYMDDPRHRQLRALLSRAFTPRRVDALEPGIRQRARQLLDAMAARGGGDFLHEFASQLPSFVIGEMIGLPAEQRPMLLECTEGMIPVVPPAGSDMAGMAARIYQVFAGLLEERRREPRDDLMTALVEAELGGEGLSEDDMLGFCFLLLVGGNDTTTNLIGNGAVLLAQHPDQRKALAEDLARLPSAIEEMLRIESPTQNQPRMTRCEVEVHGVAIPAGQHVLQVLGAANHDERRFPDPERFDIERDASGHLALGHGVHFCMGSSLARLEARVAFEELLDRFPEYALEGEAGWVASRWARAHSEIPIRFA